MPDYTRPNLNIPTPLWGEIKVAAFRRGVRPVEVVIELLREKFDDGYRKEKGLPSRASVQNLRDKVDALGSSTPPQAAEPEKPKPDQKTCKHSFVIRDEGGSVCFKCGYHPSM